MYGSKVVGLIAALTMFGAANAEAGVCETAGLAIASIGTTVASASTIAEAVGFIAVAHATADAAILSSVGVGGTGFIAGTLGTLTATALATLSSPAVIAVGAGVVIGAGGTAAYCYIAS